MDKVQRKCHTFSMGLAAISEMRSRRITFSSSAPSASACHPTGAADGGHCRTGMKGEGSRVSQVMWDILVRTVPMKSRSAVGMSRQCCDCQNSLGTDACTFAGSTGPTHQCRSYKTSTKSGHHLRALLQHAEVPRVHCSSRAPYRVGQCAAQPCTKTSMHAHQGTLEAPCGRC